MIIDIEIFGHPYHSYNYTFWNNSDLIILFNTYCDNYDSALHYIDGIFALHLTHDNGVEQWITDPFGEYPIFINNIDGKILPNFNNNDTYIPNSSYILLADRNYDKSYHSNRMNADGAIPFITPWKNWKVSTPSTIYTINNSKISTVKYQLIEYPDDSYIDAFSNCIRGLSKSRKVLIPLSAGYDSRGIYSVITGDNSIDYYRYTYGAEKEYIDSLELDSNCMPDFDGDYEKQIKNHILDMNGMGDIYYKCHNFYIQQYWDNYDILFTGDGGNEFLSKPNFNHSAIYATGDGHHYKTQINKIKTVSPYCNKRFLYLANKTGRSRYEIIHSIICANNDKLLDFEFYSGDRLTGNKLSNFGHSFNFNTKAKYLNLYYEAMNGMSMREQDT